MRPEQFVEGGSVLGTQDAHGWQQAFDSVRGQVDYIPEKEFLVTFRPLSRAGSIRDLIHNVSRPCLTLARACVG